MDLPSPSGEAFFRESSPWQQVAISTRFVATLPTTDTQPFRSALVLTSAGKRKKGAWGSVAMPCRRDKGACQPAHAPGGLEEEAKQMFAELHMTCD